MIKLILHISIFALGIYTANAQRIVFNKISLPKQIKNINCIEIQKDKVWIGTNKGLVKIRGEKQEVFYDNSEPDKFKINSIHISKKDEIWLGNYRNSLINFKNGIKSKELKFLNQSGKAVGLVTNITSKNDNIWCSSSAGQILKYDTKSNTSKTYLGVDDTNLFSVVSIDGTNTWVASGEGLLLTNNFSTWKSDKKVLQASGMIVLQDKIYAIGRGFENESLILVLNEIKNKWEIIKINELPDKYIKFNDIDIDSRGNIWIASNYGIIKYDISQKRCFLINQRNSKDFDIREVKNIAIQNDNILWVSSAGNDLYKILL